MFEICFEYVFILVTGSVSAPSTWRILNSALAQRSRRALIANRTALATALLRRHDWHWEQVREQCSPALFIACVIQYALNVDIKPGPTGAAGVLFRLTSLR